MKKLIQFVFLLLSLFPAKSFSQECGHDGGSVFIIKDPPPMPNQIIESKIQKIMYNPYHQMDRLLFADPMGNGGMNSFGKTVTNYVDHDTSNGLLDYKGVSITYNGHRGTDIELLNFYDRVSPTFV